MVPGDPERDVDGLSEVVMVGAGCRYVLHVLRQTTNSSWRQGTLLDVVKRETWDLGVLHGVFTVGTLW